MTDERRKRVEALVSAIPELTAGQLRWVERVFQVFGSPHHFEPLSTDLLSASEVENFGDAMRIHHCFSGEPFSKDKFEYVLISILKFSGRNAVLAPKGNPGHDCTVDDVRISLKTQADQAIKADEIWISKFMELGKGKWGSSQKDLTGLRDQFLAHLNRYDRILILRALEKAPDWEYELVEIPKELLQRAGTGKIRIDRDSKQRGAKPGRCELRDDKKRLLFELYFDGGTERKLQVKKLKKSECRVHARWTFTIAPE